MIGWLTRAHRDQRGASLILVTAAILAILGMVALTADIGAGMAERRIDQTGADLSAVSGALETMLTTAPNPLQAAVNQVYTKVNENLDLDPTAAEWTACTDPGALQWRTRTHGLLLGVVGGSDCISFNYGYTKIRVRIPDRDTATTFGRVLNIPTIKTHAFAEAGLNGFGGGGSFPSGALSGTGAGAEICIKTGTGSQVWDSCGSPSTGDFGNFKPYWYGPVDGSNASICNSAEQPLPMARAMADGIDHQFGVFLGTNRINGSQCPGFPGPAFPNMVDSAAGYANQDITRGLVTGGSWPATFFPGRLTRSFTSGYGSATIFTRSVDNRALWTYIDTSLGVPSSCSTAAANPANPATPADYYTALAEMKTCLQDATGQIFSLAIDNTSRLSAVPRFSESALLPSNACCYHIIDYTPIFIQGVYARNNHPTFQCTGTMDNQPDMCVHHPGMTGNLNVNPPGLKLIDSASALILRCQQLPSVVCARVGGGPGGRNLVAQVELTR